MPCTGQHFIILLRQNTLTTIYHFHQQGGCYKTEWGHLVTIKNSSLLQEIGQKMTPALNHRSAQGREEAEETDFTPQPS